MLDPRALIAEAEKLSKPQSGFFSFLGGSLLSRLEDACDLRVQAANSYRLNKQFALAGQQFRQAAEIQKQLNNLNDVANHLIEAYKCYKSESPPDAIECLEQAIHIFLTQNGQFRRAANFQMDLAALYELIADVDSATAAYEKAGDFYLTDHAEALSNKAYLKCADLNAGAGNYSKARDLYDTVIQNALGNSMTRWSLKEYFVKNLFCTLAMEDVVEAQKRLERYNDEEPSFAATREYKLVQEILELIQEGDPQRFSDVVYEYDQFSKLDKLKTQMLLRIKTSVVEKDGDDLT